MFDIKLGLGARKKANVINRCSTTLTQNSKIAFLYSLNTESQPVGLNFQFNLVTLSNLLFSGKIFQLKHTHSFLRYSRANSHQR